MKTTLAVTIEASIAEEARMKGINISEAAERGIAAACGADLPDKPRHMTPAYHAQEALEEKPELKDQFIKAMDKDKSHAKGWKTRLTLELGIKLSLEDVIQLYNMIRGNV